MLRYTSTLAFLSVAAAWSTDTESSVQHPDAHIDGFVISAVHLHGDDGSLHRRRLRFDDSSGESKIAPLRRDHDALPLAHNTEYLTTLDGGYGVQYARAPRRAGGQSCASHFTDHSGVVERCIHPRGRVFIKSTVRGTALLRTRPLPASVGAPAPALVSRLSCVRS